MTRDAYNWLSINYCEYGGFSRFDMDSMEKDSGLSYGIYGFNCEVPRPLRTSACN